MPKFSEFAHSRSSAPLREWATGENAGGGFIWRLEQAGFGIMQMSGSDGMAEGRSWTRFWLNGTLHVARARGDENYLRASYGRAVAEAAFWAPAALLPQHGVRWEETGEPDRARAVITHGTLEQTIEITVAEKRVLGTRRPPLPIVEPAPGHTLGETISTDHRTDLG